MTRKPFWTTLCCAALAAASARAELRIIDVTAETQPKRPKGAPAAPAQPELQLVMNESETTRNLSPGVMEALGALGYVVNTEIDFERIKPDRTAKTMLRFEVVRMGGACFVTAKASEVKTLDVVFWRYETKDDSLSCTEQLKRAVADFAVVRPPAKAPSPDAGSPAAGGDGGEGGSPGDAEAAKPPKMHLAPTLVQPEPEPLAPVAAPAPAADAGAPAAEPAPKKKGCGCSAGGEPALAALLALLGALARRR